MTWRTLLALPRWVWLSLAVAGAVSLGVVQGQRWHQSAVATAATGAADRTRDSVNLAAVTILAAAKHTSDIESGALREARARQSKELRALRAVIASRTATDALSASLERLSDSARADTTVAVLATASQAVATENDSLKVMGGRLIAEVAIVTERADAVHAADTAAIRGLATAVVVVRDSLAVEVARPKRTWKSNVVISVIGAGAGVLLHVVRQ